jgi:hypothetical protein
MPTLIDIFNNRPFRAVELTAAMEQIVPVPTLLGNMGEALFRTVRSRFRTVAIFKRQHVMRLIPVSPIGAPPVQLEKVPGEMRNFGTRRIAKATTVYAEEMQGLLAMPDFQATTTMQAELAQRAGLIRDDVELTHEHQRLGAVQGMVIDADGTTVLDDWFANWGVPVPAAFNFHFDIDTTPIRAICDNVRNAIWLASKGAWVDGQTEIHALCGMAFFQDLIGHPMVERTYLNYAAAAELRGEIADTFLFGGIVWHRYRGGTMTEFAIPDNQCRFFPMRTNGEVFQRVMGPAEFDPFINTPGQDLYALTIPDRDRGAWVATELYNYPLYVCLRPEMLQTGIAS